MLRCDLPAGRRGPSLSAERLRSRDAPTSAAGAGVLPSDDSPRPLLLAVFCYVLASEAVGKGGRSLSRSLISSRHHLPLS